MAMPGYLWAFWQLLLCEDNSATKRRGPQNTSRSANNANLGVLGAGPIPTQNVGTTFRVTGEPSA